MANQQVARGVSVLKRLLEEAEVAQVRQYLEVVRWMNTHYDDAPVKRGQVIRLKVS